MGNKSVTKQFPIDSMVLIAPFIKPVWHSPHIVTELVHLYGISAWILEDSVAENKAMLAAIHRLNAG